MLYGHSQDLTAAMPFIRRTRPQFWKAIDPNPDAARECADLGVKLIVRHFGPWDFNVPYEASVFVDFCAAQPWFPYAWAVETPNEPHDSHTAAFMSACVLGFRQRGKECVVGNWGTGWSGWPVPGATYYASHEYGWPLILSQQPWHALRFPSWWGVVLGVNPNAQLFITECGTTQAVEGRADVGWQSEPIDPAVYWASLVEYDTEASKYLGYLGAFVYQVGGFADWATFEHLGTAMEDRLATALTTPESNPEQPQGHIQEETLMGPEIWDTHRAQLEAWWQAGGWKNGASFLVATGQIDATDKERRELVLDRIESATKEASSFLLSLPLT